MRFGKPSYTHNAIGAGLRERATRGGRVGGALFAGARERLRALESPAQVQPAAAREERHLQNLPNRHGGAAQGGGAASQSWESGSEMGSRRRLGVREWIGRST